MHQRARCLYSRQQVQAALDTMARKISADLSGSDPIILCVMTGAVITVAELALRLKFPLQLDYVHASRYAGNTTGAELQWQRQPSLGLKDRTVLVVDDILDQGATLENIVNYCRGKGARQVLSAVLIDKQHRRKLSALQADYIGLSCEDFYVYGYGMDYKGYLRNADGIYAVADEDL